MDFLLQMSNWVLPAVFFLLVFSFLTMTLVEMVDTGFNFRSCFIKKGIFKILGDELAPPFLENAIVNPLREKTAPSYIEPGIFAYIIMLWVMRGNQDLSIPESQESKTDLSIKQMQKNINLLAKKSHHLYNLLKTLATKTAFQTNIAQEFSARLEESLKQWYADAQYQIDGYYKRCVQKQLMIFGFIVAAFANFDLIRMVSVLWQLSMQMQRADLAQKTGQHIDIDISPLTPLPLGWQRSDFAIFTDIFAFFVKFLGISIGAFLIFIFAQYIYDFVKGRLTKFTHGQN
jgi:hypothetical protein